MLILDLVLLAAALATTIMVVNIPPSSTTYGWSLGTSSLVTSVLAGGAPTAVGKGFVPLVAPSAAGMLVYYYRQTSGRIGGPHLPPQPRGQAFSHNGARQGA